jgi:hypothetical protein
LPNPKIEFGIPQRLDASGYEGLSILAARSSEQLQDFLPQYVPLPGRKRGFQFVARNLELVSEISGAWAGVPSLLKKLEIRPRFNCETRLAEIAGRPLGAILVVDISMRWQIHAELEELMTAGVELSGLYAVRKDFVPGKKNLLGRIRRLHDGQIELSECYDGVGSIASSEARLEPTKQSFVRCVDSILKARRQDFWKAFDVRQADYLSGDGFDECLQKLVSSMRKHKSIYIGPDIGVAVGARVQVNRGPSPASVNYCFDAGKTKQHKYAWVGLNEHGPYDRESFPKRAPKLLLVCPAPAQSRVEQAAKKLRDGISGGPYSKGFCRTFHLTSLTIDTCPVSVNQSSSSGVASEYVRAVEAKLQRGTDYDAALVVIDDQHSDLPDQANPYLFTKAILLTNGIPVQEAKLSTMTKADDSLAWILQNISVALYAKLGGIPWTVNQDQTVNDEVVVGMGLVETSGSRFQSKQRVVGITTVFRGDGNYLLANVAKECPFEEYREQLRQTMVEVLREVKQRNGWRAGDSVRVVFHASKPLRDLEVDELMHECVSQAAPEQVVQFAFMDVLQDHPFHIFDPDQKGKVGSGGLKKGSMVPDRGTAFQLGRQTWLLSTNGISQIKRSTAPLPSPLLIHLHRKSTGCDLPYLTDQVLKFTSLTWRSTQPASEPVTIYYSTLIAHLLTRLKAVPGWSPNVLNTRLRASKWFL